MRAEIRKHELGGYIVTVFLDPLNYATHKQIRDYALTLWGAKLLAKKIARNYRKPSGPKTITMEV